MARFRVIKIYGLLILIFLSMGFFISCNSQEKNSKNDTTATATAVDTGVNRTAKAAETVPGLPAVPEGAKVYFRNLKNGQSVESPFKVEMGVKNIKVDTAGPVVYGEGHHHLLIDSGDSLASGEVIPKDDRHLHFGKGQTFSMVELPKGVHRLTLQFGDGIHRSYGSRLAASIEIKVK